jgi:hypothetical protein
MSLRRVDARFVLPEAPAAALVVGNVDGWRDGLRAAGVEVESPAHPLPLAVATAADANVATASGARMVLVEGRGARRVLAKSFPVVERFLAIPSLEIPQLILPLSQPHVGDYAVRNWSLATSWRRRLRNEVARPLLRWQLVPDLRRVFAVGVHQRRDPFLVQAVRSLGVPQGCGWFLTLGTGDPLTRGVFHLFPPGSETPGWVLKFARVAGYAEPFDRDEHGLGLAATAGGVVLRHAPRLLGRRIVAGLSAAVETAAVGSRLTLVLQGASDRSRKLRAIDAVARWTIESALATAVPPERLEPERRRLAEEVVPAWRDLGVPLDLVERVGPVPAVFQHNDLGSWNLVMGRGSDFSAVDWESARADGFPLWDLVYFLTDAITHLDGASLPELRNAHNVRLFRGELSSSAILFNWLRRSCAALSIREEQVAPIVTLCWLHHGLSGGHRRAAVDAHAPDQRTGELPDAERIARLWLATPGLGPTWDCWRLR